MSELALIFKESLHSLSEEDVKLVVDCIKKDPGEINALQELLRSSIHCRDMAPLLLTGLSEMYLDTPARSTEIEELLKLFPTVCRPAELHALSLETWISLWQRSCSCTTHVTHECRLNNLRSIVGLIVVEVIRKAQKGPLSRNKENYMLSIAGQLLSKFLIPELEHPVHSINQNWIECVLGICSGLREWSANDAPEQQRSANAEISLRMLSGLLSCQLIRLEDPFGNNHNMESNEISDLISDPVLLSTLTTKVSSLELPAVGLNLSPPASRSADFELESSDLALLVLASDLAPSLSTTVIPMIWSFPKQADICVKVALILLRSRFPTLGAIWSVRVLKDRSPRFDQIFRSHFSDVWLEELIGTATSFGDETVMSLQDRQSIYTGVFDALLASEHSVASTLCLSVIARSRSDATVGIFIKILKDVWAKDNLSTDLFHKVVELSCTTEYQVVDGIDSLKSILNWARLVYLRSSVSASPSDVAFQEFLNGVSRQIDIELGILMPRSDGESEMKKTRLVFIGHLVSRVKEIMKNPNSSSVCYSETLFCSFEFLFVGFTLINGCLFKRTTEQSPFDGSSGRRKDINAFYYFCKLRSQGDRASASN
jgi:hypothetical protein